MPASDLPLTLNVNSDIEALQKVIVHRPDPGIEWVTPGNAESLLYDDIVFLPQMMHQHLLFQQVIQAVLGQDALIEFQDLLEELLTDTPIRNQILQLVFEFETVNQQDQKFIGHLPPASLAATLISGVVPGLPRTLLSPLPNHIFTRDLGAVVNSHFFTCLASKRPRMRESILIWFVTHFHPLFKHVPHVDLCSNPQQLLKALNDPAVAIEGGDLMVINRENLFIGCSERTNQYTIEKVARLMFELDLVQQITMIDIPKLPTCIHLDTLFTQIAAQDFVYYQPYLGASRKFEIKQYRGSVDKVKHFHSIRELMEDIQPNVNLIPCGDGRYPYDEREQYASGCNFVALKNSVAISYARNLKTLEALKSFGYHVVPATEFLQAVEDRQLEGAELSRLIITIPSSELCRAGGGPHCLTLPLVRIGN